MSEIVASGGYLVYEETGEKVVFYECDPAKNIKCDKTFCRLIRSEDQDIGFCAKTTNPKYRKDGGKKWYAVWKRDEDGEPYWGREYIEEA